MIINCPNCKSELEFPEESVGANVRCGACGIKFASLDAIYAKGMECRGIAQKFHDEGKENESIEAWEIAYQYFLLAGGGGHADAQYQGRWIYEHGLGAKKSEEVQQGGEIVRTIQERAFAAIKESFRLIGRCIVELDHVERGTAFTRYVLKSSEEEKFRRVFYSRAKSEDLAETIGNRLGKLGVKADSSCSVYIPAEGVERLSFWEVIAGVEGKIQPFFGEDRRSQYEFWEVCKGRGEMHMQDIAYALPYVSAVGTVISPAALSGGIHIILGDHGSGKTTCLNAAICTLVLFRPSSCVRIAVLDPVGEMPEYAGLPHLSYGGTVVGYENCKRTLRRICNEIEWREQTIREYSSSLRPDVNLKLLSAGGDAIPLYAVFIDNLDALVRLGDKEIFDCLAKLSCAWHEGFYTVATSKNFSRSVFKVPHACGYVDWCMMFSMSISDAKAYNLCALSELVGARKSNVPGAIFGASSYPRVGEQATFITKEDVAEVIAIARSQDKERAFRKRMGRSFGKDGQESPESPRRCLPLPNASCPHKDDSAIICADGIQEPAERGGKNRMTARLNGREVNVLAVDPVMTFALVSGMRKTADVAEGGLPPSGEAYIYQQPQEDERFLQVEYEMVSEFAKAAGMKIPSLRQISKFNGLVRFRGEYEMRRDEEDEWEAAFKSIEPLETPYELTEDNELVPLGVDEPIEQKRTHWRDFILSIPPPAKGASDELYLTLAYEFYDAIKAGTKTTEYRDYTPNWVKRTLSHPIRTVKFQRGYGGPGHPPPEQMIWTVKGVWLYESATKTKGDPSNPPQGIIPDCIAIDLGCRVV